MAFGLLFLIVPLVLLPPIMPQVFCCVRVAFLWFSSKEMSLIQTKRMVIFCLLRTCTQLSLFKSDTLLHYLCINFLSLFLSFYKGMHIDDMPTATNDLELAAYEPYLRTFTLMCVHCVCGRVLVSIACIIAHEFFFMCTYILCFCCLNTDIFWFYFQPPMTRRLGSWHL